MRSYIMRTVNSSSSLRAGKDEQIRAYVKEILDKANLEEITMKTVCKQVYAKYPDFDLIEKKDFIKATVKTLLATTTTDIIIYKYKFEFKNDNRLRIQCELADRALFSADASVKTEDIDQTSLIRRLFDNLNNDLFKKLEELVNSALENAGLDNSDTDCVNFVGTCTRIPMVEGILPGISQHESVESFKQDEAALYGIPVRAAQFAEDVLKKLRRLSLNDFTLFSLQPIINEHVQKQLVKKKLQNISSTLLGGCSGRRLNL
uniref:DEK_C domain-containing protein n=1 Tax=Glossina pallidipes TaxID=7398 RepID=A0A1A9ZGH8_GLOPL